MKKIISISMAVMLSVTSAAQAKVGDVIGVAYNTDIVSYINHYAIPSYAVNGTSCIVAEDLRNFGFDVTWDNDTRSLTISKNAATEVAEMSFKKEAAPASKFADLLETDIVVYAGDTKLTSYAINGYTFIPIEELTMFGECYWVAEERALKLWVEGLGMRSAKQAIDAYVAPITVTTTSYTSSSSYSGSSSYSDSSSYIGSEVYITPSGKRYHYSSACAGKNGYAVTLSKAKSSGRTACQKCAQ